MEKSKKFKEGNQSYNLTDFFRKEIIGINGKRKMVLFIVKGLDFAKNQGGIIFDEKSDKILKQERKNFDDTQVFYIWESDDFEKQQKSK